MKNIQIIQEAFSIKYKRGKNLRKLLDELLFTIKRNPVFFVLIILLIGESIVKTDGNFLDWLYDKVMILPGIVIGISFHEFAHAYASYKFGDPTPKDQGRLTLNPLTHFSGLGFICLMLLGFGWGRPVQINPVYYKKRRRDEFIVSIAGVVTNLLLAVIFSLIWNFTISNAYFSGNMSTGMEIVSELIINVIGINIVLMAFNLIPCPPLDGFNAITQIFNLQKYSWWYQLYNYGQWILVFLIAFNIQSFFVHPIYNFTMDLMQLLMAF